MPILTIKNPEDFYEKFYNSSDYNSNNLIVVLEGKEFEIIGIDGFCYIEPIEVSKIILNRYVDELIIEINNDVELSLDEIEDDVLLLYFNEIPTIILAKQSFEYQPHFNTVKSLVLHGLEENFDFIRFFNHLEELIISYIYKNVNLEIIGSLSNLKSVTLNEVLVKDISFIKKLINLENLIISCDANSISGIENCKKLKQLEISRCYHLRKVSEIQYLVNLEKLTIYNYWTTSDVSWLLPLKKLVDLEVSFYSCMLNNHLFLELTNLKRLD